MFNCINCGESVELNQSNVWDIFHFCNKCENKLEDSTKCPECKKSFLQLRESEFKGSPEFKEHMIKCNKVFIRLNNNKKRY